MNRVGGSLQIAGLSISDLAEQYGTPLYIYDGASIRQRFDALAHGIPYRPLRLFYSIKANPAVGIVRFIAGLGAGVDACSPGDLAVAAAAGVPEASISYVGHAMSDAELEAVGRTDASFTADSIDQIVRFGGRFPGRGIGIRANMGIEAGFHPVVRTGSLEGKFGLHPDQFDQALKQAIQAQIRIVGLHAHLGSDILDGTPHAELVRRLIQYAPAFPDLEWINIGGGWGTPFTDSDDEYPIAQLGKAIAAALDGASQRLEVRLEPGAYLVMDAGVLVSRVVETKMPFETTSGMTPAFACTDSSYNHVISAVIYDTHRNLHVDGDRTHVEPRPWTITGNLMQAGDILARDRMLPISGAGDLLVMENCGAYASSRSPVFNERPRLPEILVDDGQATLIRRAETIHDLLTRDRGQVRLRRR